MTRTTTVLIVLVMFALAVPGVVGSGFAAPIPGFFENEWVGFVCLTASPPGSPPTTFLVQFNFDKSAGGGISLTRANSLFTFLASNLGLLSPTIGSNPQTTCSYTPSQILVLFPGATALEAAQLVSGSFQQLGYSRYIIVDAFFNLTNIYFGSVEVLRSEVFLVPGDNELLYVTSNEIAKSLAP